MEENAHHAEAVANTEKAHANEDVAERFEPLLSNLKERRSHDP